VPCHRVVAANGSIGGFMGKVRGKSIQKKIALLENEGVRVINGSIAEFENKMLNF
jgi:alkylated DNA nucleotide flippase Atl1